MTSEHDQAVARNRAARDLQVEAGNEWTVPVGQDIIAAARGGDWSVVLIGYDPVPRDWFPASLAGADVLCLASGGGQQRPVLAAAGARVTVFDNSPAQLARRVPRAPASCWADCSLPAGLLRHPRAQAGLSRRSPAGTRFSEFVAWGRRFGGSHFVAGVTAGQGPAPADKRE